MSENRKNLDLPGKKNYEKYKHLIIKIFSPKEKANTYSLIQKRKKNIFFNNINSIANKKNEVKVNKSNSKSNKKVIKTNNYHRQIIKYINNEGKELFLLEPDLNDKNNKHELPKKNDINHSEFIKLIKENQINIKNSKNKNQNKVKSQNKNNKIMKNKNSLEYKLKNIKKVFGSKSKKKKK